MKIDGQSFLVTGGCGFIGSSVVELLLARGAGRVVLLDKVRGDGILTELHTHPKVEIIQGDLLEKEVLTRALKGVAGVFHMAVLPLGASAQDPGLAVDVNIRGTFQVIEEARRAGVEKIVYSSASSVYGDTHDVMDENHPLNPWSMYGITKLCGEFLFRPFRDELPYAIVRYMNVYGPRQQGGLIPAVLRNIRSGTPPVVMGDGSSSYDFIHVRDVADCTVLAMSRDVTAEAFNVGSGTEVTVKDIVTMLLELSNSSLTPTYQPAPPGSMTRRVGNSEKAKRLLGFQPHIMLRQGLEELAANP